MTGFSSLALGLDQSTSVFLASVLGYSSIAFWLCAQLPQVLKNLSLRSCEGLALPFLINWLFGDITNLVGCLLTDQLPFQTYLAAYFCIVDIALVAQYLHYRRHQPAPTPRHTYSSLGDSPRQVTTFPPNSAPPIKTRSVSGPVLTTPLPSGSQTAGLARPKPRRGKWSATPSGYFPAPDIAVTSPADGSYAAIYEAAIGVARAAERANARSHSRRRRLSRRNTSNSLQAGSDLAVDEDYMADSYHSDMSALSGGSTTKNSPKRPPAGSGGINDRGRTLKRGGQGGSTGYLGGFFSRGGANAGGNITTGATAGDFLTEEEDNFDSLSVQGQGGLGFEPREGDPKAYQRGRSKESSTSRSISLVRGSGGRGSRRTAGMAFMSLGLLVGWGGFGGRAYGVGKGRQAVALTGVVLTVPTPWPVLRHPPVHAVSSSLLASSNSLFLEFPRDVGLYDEPDHPPYPPEEQSLQRIIGRISAWSCTTLYLTSRLPQIWKNFQRKSVEGLSILLFVFAFCGNVTYVSSILLNPSGGADPAEASHYLLEALPYLLGSGGTLVFDLTIMIQSFIYGSAPPVPLPPTPVDRSRRKLFLSRKKVRHMEDGWGSMSQSQSLERRGGERAPLLSGSISGLPGPHRVKGTKRDRSMSPTVHKRARSVAT